MAAPDDEPTQETQPAKGLPVEIPVPDRDDVLSALRRVAKADEGAPPDDEAPSDQ